MEGTNAMKRKIALFMIILLLPCFSAFAENEPAVQWELFVSPSGSDDGDGTKEHPYRTIERAQAEVRTMNSQMTGDIVVNLLPGRYELSETIEFTAEDSGSNHYDVIYRGSGDDTTLSGGKTVSGWKESENGIWTVPVEADFVRELYVNEIPASRASSSKRIAGIANYQDPNSYYKNYGSDGFYANKSEIGRYKNPGDIQLMWNVSWRVYYMNVEDIIDDPDNENQVIVKMEQPAWGAMYATTAATSPRFNYGFTVENAKEVLDEPGEFYFDKQEKLLYYMPREGQDMTTAETIVPSIDRLVMFRGKHCQTCDGNLRVKNIRFENVRFAHSTWSAVEGLGFTTRQAEVMNIPAARGKHVPGAVQLEYTDEVDIEGCTFFGIGTAALSLSESVKKGEYTQNVFSDIGCSALVVGKEWHSKYFEPSNPKAAANVAFRKPLIGSYQYVTGQMENYCLSMFSSYHEQFYDEFYTAMGSTWQGEPWAKDKGIKPWLMIDLEEAYTIDSIKLGFAEDVTEEQRRNIEILGSNDPKFESYITFATLDNPAANLQTIPGNKNEKVRYLMIRKTVPEDFGISQLWAYSYDEAPKGSTGICVDNTFSNNYITKIGKFNMGAPAIHALYTSGLNLSHNEINDVSYSAISLGWGWEAIDSAETGNNTVSYNKLTNYNQMCFDGAAVYTLGDQPGTKISNNYVSGQNLGQSIYFDQGTQFIVADNNAMTDVNQSVFIWHPTVMNNKVYNTYSASGLFTKNNPNNVLNEIQTFPAGSPPAEAYKIEREAGIELEYRDEILSRVPNTPDPYLRGREAFEGTVRTVNNNPAHPDPESLEKMTELFLADPTLGKVPGKSTYEEIFAIKSLYNQCIASEFGLDESLALKEKLMAAVENITHKSLDDMLAVCKEALTKATVGKNLGSYSQEAVSALQEAVNGINASDQSDEYAEYDAVLRLETAYTAFEAGKYAADVEYVYIPGGTTEINKETKKITVTVPQASDIAAIKPEFVVSAGAELALDPSAEFDFSKEVIIPVYQPEIRRYVYWKLNVVKANEPILSEKDVSAEPDLWNSLNKNIAPQLSEGALTLFANYQPYMYQKGKFNGEVNIELWAETKDANNEISLIFSSGNPKMENLDGKGAENAHYRFALSGGSARLYRVKDGQTNLVAETQNNGFVYGEWNDISIKTGTDGNYDNITVLVNGTAILNANSIEPLGTTGYFGIRCNSQKMKIK